MKIIAKISLLVALVACIAAPTASVQAYAAEPTGYTSAEDVEYAKVGGYVVNWGVRGEDCVFLSEYAESFYEGDFEYSLLAQNEGGSSQSNAPQSELYKALQSMMKAKHTKITEYQETRQMYRYTDCEGNDYSTISSFYSAKSLSGTWDSGKTWNREHTWPNSKGLGGSDEDDIMMLRPTSKSENSSRGNTAYGEGSGYYDPGESVRGDCARIMLYTYTRWGNTGRMWGKSGVMESLEILLKWMEEDPVDTWEMGRNDAVQSITGTRNAFVDYPEYAWLLFGEEVPEDMTTPSGLAKNGEATPDTPTPPVEEPPAEDSDKPSDESCAHEYGEWFVTVAPTETTEGERWKLCEKCGKRERETLPKTGGDGDIKNTITALLSGCTSTVVSPFVVSILLAGSYVFMSKGRRQG